MKKFAFINSIQFVLLLFFVAGSNLYLHAQSPGLENQKQFQIHINKTNETIKLDGELEETPWINAEKATNLSNWVPTDVGYPKRQTEFSLTYNAQYLYIGVLLYDTDYYVIKTLKRDAEVGKSDVFGIVLDPMNQHTNGYTFLVNAFNVQTEDVITGEVQMRWI